MYKEIGEEEIGIQIKEVKNMKQEEEKIMITEERFKAIEDELEKLKSQVHDLQQITQPRVMYEIVSDQLRQSRISHGIF